MSHPRKITEVRFPSTAAKLGRRESLVGCEIIADYVQNGERHLVAKRPDAEPETGAAAAAPEVTHG